jgi:hypothetical protein
MIHTNMDTSALNATKKHIAEIGFLLNLKAVIMIQTHLAEESRKYQF